MADDQNIVNQDEIELLLRGQAGGGGTETPATPSEPDPGQAVGQATPGETEAGLMSQDHIDAILGKAADSASASEMPPPASAPQPARAAGAATSEAGEGESLAQRDIEYLLNKAEAALESIQTGVDGDPPMGVAHFRLEDFAGAPASTENTTLDLIRDVDLDLRIELGRTHMYIEDVLRIGRGSVVPLDKLAGDPVDVYVNGRLIARGEVLVLNDNFCVRVTELIAGVNVA